MIFLEKSWKAIRLWFTCLIPSSGSLPAVVEKMEKIKDKFFVKSKGVVVA